MYCALKLAPKSKTSLLSTTSSAIPASSFACSCHISQLFCIGSYETNCFRLTSLFILHLHLYVHGLFSNLSSLKFSLGIIFVMSVSYDLYSLFIVLVFKLCISVKQRESLKQNGLYYQII